ncbi:MAG: hypothetical protein DWQ02_20305 [Bacteroidetes bacterium]|nr:MAG: hypothetical protein DWQ02_20305 [Bacteroidota bacterium]
MAFFPEFMHYTRRERKGIRLLFMLVIILFLIPKTFPWFKKRESVDFSRFERYIAETATNNNSDPDPTVLFPFDPNTISTDSLQLLGLPARTAQTIINYREKAGGFRSKKDLQKIYTLTPEQFDLIEPFIQIRKRKTNAFQKKEVTGSLFYFDPNLVTFEELLSLGFSKKTANTLINYRQKGGKFFSRKDLQKIYGVSNALYSRLEPYIQIAERTPKPKNEKTDDLNQKTPSAYYPSVPKIIDINKATTEDWQTLKGIGPAYSKRIINFREKLGGFSSIDQVGATYGLPDSTFRKIKPYLEFSPVFKKININSATAEELSKHPFISHKTAQVITNFRNQHGNFESIEALREIRALDDELLTKLNPYLKLGEEL